MIALLLASGIGAGTLASVSAAAAATAAPTPWTVDWASGLTFGAVGNVGPHAVADCAIATVADIEQVFERSSAPADPAPYLAAYERLARTEGEMPGASAGLVPSTVLLTWRTSGIAGTKVAAVAPLPVTQSRLEKALTTGPVYAVLNLPKSSSTAPAWIDTTDTALTAWSATSPPRGYAGSGTHVVAVVGFGPDDVLVATWGYVQPVSWALWQQMASAAWTVTP